MQGTFHWIRIMAFGYATENEELIRDTVMLLTGCEELTPEISEGEHGNKTLIFKEEIKKQKNILMLFASLGKDAIDKIIKNIDKHIDDDCVFYLRLDKQSAVTGIYEIAHHGDVISITGKIISHPARKEIAVTNMTAFLNSLDLSVPSNLSE